MKRKPVVLVNGILSEKPASDGLDITPAEIGATPYHGVSVPGTITWSDSAPDRTLSVSGLSYYYNGVLVESVTTTVQITNTVGLWYIYFAAADGVLIASQSSWSIYTKIPIATVFWNGTAGAPINERHTHDRNLRFHAMLHSSVGVRYGSGLELTAPSSGSPTIVAVASGTLWDEDLLATVGSATSCRLWYQTGASTYTWETSSTLYGSAARYVNSSYVLTSAAVNQYVNLWVYSTPDLSIPVYVFLETLASPYNTLALARAATPPALSGLGLTPELKLIYKVIFKGDESFVEKVDYRNSSSLPAGGTASSSAGSTTFAPTATITSTNTQSAIEEVDSKKPDFLVVQVFS